MKPGATTPHLHPGTIFCLPEPSHIELPCCEEATPRLCQYTSTAWDQPFQRHPFRCRGTKERMIRSSKMKESPIPKARPTSIVIQGRTVIHDKMFDEQIKSCHSTNLKQKTNVNFQNIHLCFSSKPTQPHPKKKRKRIHLPKNQQQNQLPSCKYSKNELHQREDQPPMVEGGLFSSTSRVVRQPLVVLGFI